VDQQLYLGGTELRCYKKLLAYALPTPCEFMLKRKVQLLYEVLGIKYYMDPTSDTNRKDASAKIDKLHDEQVNSPRSLTAITGGPLVAHSTAECSSIGLCRNAV
jgi:hypothetical protein